MESLMRSDIQRCCSHGDRAKIKGFMKSLLSKLAMEIKWLPNMDFWISVRGIWFCFVTRKRLRWRGRESCTREMWRFLCCAPESAIFSSTGFLFIHYIQQLEPRRLAQTLHLPVSILLQMPAACLIQLKGYFSPPGWVLLAHSWLCVISSLSVMFFCFMAFKSTQSRWQSRTERKIIIIS